MELSKESFGKINCSTKLTVDEKKYLSLYATDMCNLSIVHGKISENMLIRDKGFNMEAVSDILKKDFPLLDSEP